MKEKGEKARSLKFLWIEGKQSQRGKPYSVVHEGVFYNGEWVGKTFSCGKLQYGREMGGASLNSSQKHLIFST